MRLEQLLDQQGLFSKIEALKDIMEQGVLDFVAHSHNIQAAAEQDLDAPKQAGGRAPLESLLRLAEVQKGQGKSGAREPDFGGKGLNASDLNDQGDQEAPADEGAASHETFKKLLDEVQNPLRLPNARLNVEHVRPADRATYLLNYLYMQIQRDQLLVDNF